MSKAPMKYTHAAVVCNNTTPVTALANTAGRKYALFVNDSANTIYLSVGGTAIANTGIRLNANGGSFEMSAEEGNLAPFAVTAISAAGTGQNLLVTSG